MAEGNHHTKLNPPTLDLGVERYSVFLSWKEKWQDYVLLLKLTEKDKNYQGYFTSRFKINASGKEAKIKCYVCENVRGALLGRPALMALELVQIKLFQEVSCSAVADEKRENEFVKEYPKLFTGLGRIKGEPINIKMEEGVSPYHLSAPRRVAIPLLKQLQ